MLPRCVITERPEARTQLWIRNGVENRRAHLQHVPYCHHFLVPAHGHMDRPMGHLAATFEMSLHLLTMRLPITSSTWHLSPIHSSRRRWRCSHHALLACRVLHIHPSRLARSNLPDNGNSPRWASGGVRDVCVRWPKRACTSATRPRQNAKQDTCAALPHARAVRIFTPSLLAHIRLEAAQKHYTSDALNKQNVYVMISQCVDRASSSFNDCIWLHAASERVLKTSSVIRQVKRLRPLARSSIHHSTAIRHYYVCHCSDCGARTHPLDQHPAVVRYN